MGENNTQAFSAFVSYSHADKAAAQKLHRKLEGYRLPKHVAAQLSGRDDPAKLGQIFRDREDLPAAEDLSESVKAALARSQALIVLCSPTAKASPWVAREIETFRKLHPGRPVLAALLEGEPEEAFPEPLMQGKEPLAADLRKEGDGSRLGFLKVVAGIAGVPLDALVQRDAQRRLRRVMLVTGGTLAAMLAMAIMTVIAIQARNEAQEQRAEAEGLVEYMFSELRPQLRGVGRIDVMEGVNKRAMDYYEAQSDLTGLSDDSLQRYARILHAMGEDFESLGALDKALKKFEQAHRVTGSLLARDRQNPDRIFAHGQSEYWLGRIDELRDDYSAAEKAYLAYQGRAFELNQIQPGTLRSIMEMGWGYLNVGIAQFKARNVNDAARKSFQSAIHWMRKAERKSPADMNLKYELANAYSWLADTYYIEDDFQKSLVSRERSLFLKRQIYSADPINKASEYDLYIEERAIAIHQEKLGQKSLAIVKLRNLIHKVRKLHHHDRQNKDWYELFQKTSKDLKRLEQEGWK